MAGPIYIPRWVQVRMQFQTNQNTVGEIGIDFATLSVHTWTVAELATLVSNLAGAIEATARAAVPAAITWTRYIATDKGAAGGATYVSPIGVGGGTAGGDVENYNSTLVVSKRTGFSGRANRGRMYMPPASEDHYTGGQALPVYVTLLGTLANALLSFTNTGGVTVDWVVASRKNLFLKAISSFIIDNLPDSQRRRLPGRGR